MKTPIKEISYRQRTELFDQYPEYLESTKRALTQGLIDLGLEPGDWFETRYEPATGGDSFTAATPAMTVIILRAKS